MENHIPTHIEESIKTNVKILIADKRLFRYALTEWIIQSGLLLVGLIAAFLTAVAIWALTDSAFYAVLIKEYPIFTTSLLSVILFLSFPLVAVVVLFSIYFSNRFDILSMFRSYNVLKNRAIDTDREHNISQGKIWLVFKLGVWAMLRTIRLSAAQINKAKMYRTREELTFYDPTLVLPIVLFENLSKEEALRISSEINSKDILLFIKQSYKRDFSLIGYQFKILGLLIAIIFIFWYLFGKYLDTTILFAATFLIYFCLQTFTMLKRRYFMQVYLIALYCAVRNINTN